MEERLGKEGEIGKVESGKEIYIIFILRIYYSWPKTPKPQNAKTQKRKTEKPKVLNPLEWSDPLWLMTLDQSTIEF